MKKTLKRCLSLFLAITIIFSSAYVGLSEVDFSGLFAIEVNAASEDDLTFTLNDDGESYSVECDVSASGELVIPSTYEGLPVTSIGNNAFRYCENLTSVIIPDSVTSIGAIAFQKCTSLTSVIIGDGVTSIGNLAFNGCTSLTLVKIGASVTSIGHSAFKGCTSLESIVIPDSVTSIGSNAFASCTSITSIIIGCGIKSINANVFLNCDNLMYIFYSGSESDLTIEQHSSVYLPDIHYNATDHSYEYVIDKEATCTDDGIKHPECIVCGYSLADETISAHGHDYLTEWTVDTQANCTEMGSKSHHCSRCDEKTDITVIPALGHSYSDEWIVDVEATCTTAGSKSHHCTACGDKVDVTVITETGHSYGEWVVILEPNCVNEGSKHKTCSSCGDVVTEIIATNGHDYSTEWTIDVEATCTVAGSKSHHCTICGDKTDVTEIEATGHNYGDWVVTSEPTCTQEGTKQKICSVCGDIISETIGIIDHEYSTEWTVDIEPTQSTDGEKSRHCLNCSARTDITAIPCGLIDDILCVETDGILCNGEITYIIKLKAGISVSGASFGVVYDPEVLVPVEEKCGACTTVDSAGNELINYNGLYVNGMKNNTDDTYIVAYVNTNTVKRSQNTPFIKFTFKVKDFSVTQTAVDFYCAEFIGSSTIYKNDYTSFVSQVDEAIYSYDHTMCDEWTIDIEPTCTEDGSKSHHCAICDFKTDITVIEATGHNYGDWVVNLSPTCTEDGSKSKTCPLCNDIVTEAISANGHNYSEEWTIDVEPTCTEDGSKSHHCTVCSDKTDVTVIEATGHNYGEWVVNAEPTCTEDGSKSKTCSLCNDIVTEAIPADGHNYSEEWTIDVEPTCTEDGNESRHCTVCDDKTDVTVIEATGHNYGEWVVNAEPTCTEDGSKSKTCSLCNDVVTEVIYANGHNYSDEWTIDVEPTCAVDGSKSHHCLYCEAFTDITVIEATNEHSYGDWVVTVEPTCEEYGEAERTCSVCGDIESSTDYENELDIITPLGHSYSSEWIIDYEPNCTENGLKHRECDVCTYVDEQSIRRTGHSYGEWVTIKTNCLEDGYAQRNCSECDAIQTRYKDGKIILDSSDTYSWHEAVGVYMVEISCSGASYIEVTFGEITGTQDLFFYSDTSGLIQGSASDFSYSTVCFEGDSVLFGVSTLFSNNYCIEIESVVAYTERDESLGQTDHNYVLQTYDDKHPHTREYKCSYCDDTKTEKPVVSDCIECNFTITAIDSSSYKLVSYIGSETDVVIPATYKERVVTTIANGCFKGNTTITSVKIGEGVTTIGSLAFMNCTSLDKVIIPESVTSIGANAFYGFTGTIYCVSGSTAHEYAVANNIKYVLLNIFETENTQIDYVNYVIRTKVQGANDITEILSVSENALVVPIASYVYGNLELYGTGTIISVFDGNDYIGDFTLIVEGDTNGDSVCDILDVFDVKRASNGNIELSGAYKMAADSNSDDIIDINDYQNVVNVALAS